MSTITDPTPAAIPASPEGGIARALATAARWTEVYSQAAVRIARVGTVAAVTLAILSLAGNVFTRNVLGYSLFGAEELARFAFLWAIWLGVSLADTYSTPQFTRSWATVLPGAVKISIDAAVMFAAAAVRASCCSALRPS